MLAHSKSFEHRMASRRAAEDEAETFIPVAAQIDSYHSAQQSLRKQGLLSHLRTLKTLLRQGVAIRGDN